MTNDGVPNVHVLVFCYYVTNDHILISQNSTHLLSHSLGVAVTWVWLCRACFRISHQVAVKLSARTGVSSEGSIREGLSAVLM